ncbi:hypothetical protein NIES2135_53420 [Leptolyngbya boryana NIES-2135]|jgi:hypothetical protein|uniref:Uncharacterized protein n=1 Tax=Leptolyngbya boryana NIES-2135 TaxID=1973484 RepID=A0A1Z4JP19_LEPBY|nr:MULTISPECIES: hypothetical protein [Leptolyngbya]BAY58469.1 hypothetical protein NIES2135_53420 [Leptolyngbya boryana NIES-2135]MBD2370943.1 hypothetical protein [Leptolyngbya sp. FACHB-161]MBD2377457.1 hypothetical protein [Leptolyngbya sp. FACHB-238]MBD2401865.1 hypothetical protein [Leptolyngbya sp. FACHB-239]MBD2408383.1 hypothetical protein [Leptolyngbya sp. FACHB-402]
MSEEPKRGRGRPRKYENSNDRQVEWKKRTDFEKSEKRRKYKAEWAARKRRQQAGEQ